MLLGVGSQSITLQLLHAVLLGRALPVVMYVAFMSLNPVVLPMILKPITAVLPLCFLDLFPSPRLLPRYQRYYRGCGYRILLQSLGYLDRK